MCPCGQRTIRIGISTYISTCSIPTVSSPTTASMQSYRIVIGPHQGPNIFATLKFEFFLGNTSTESGIHRDYAVQTVFDSTIEHHFSVFDTSQLWGKGCLVLLCHITNQPGGSLKLLFRIGEFDRRLTFLVADFHLSDHLLNANIPPRQEVS